MSKNPPTLSIATEKVCFIIIKAQNLDHHPHVHCIVPRAATEARMGGLRQASLCRAETSFGLSRALSIENAGVCDDTHVVVPAKARTQVGRGAHSLPVDPASAGRQNDHRVLPAGRAQRTPDRLALGAGDARDLRTPGGGPGAAFTRAPAPDASARSLTNDRHGVARGRQLRRVGDAIGARNSGDLHQHGPTMPTRPWTRSYPGLATLEHCAPISKSTCAPASAPASGSST
jgi:hypothetical protein